MSRSALGKDQRETLTLTVMVWPVELYNAPHYPVFGVTSEGRRFGFSQLFTPETPDDVYARVRAEMQSNLAASIAQELGLTGLALGPARWSHTIETYRPLESISGWVVTSEWEEGPHAQAGLSHPRKGR